MTKKTTRQEVIDEKDLKHIRLAGIDLYWTEEEGIGNQLRKIKLPYAEKRIDINVPCIIEIEETD